MNRCALLFAAAPPLCGTPPPTCVPPKAAPGSAPPGPPPARFAAPTPVRCANRPPLRIHAHLRTCAPDPHSNRPSIWPMAAGSYDIGWPPPVRGPAAHAAHHGRLRVVGNARRWAARRGLAPAPMEPPAPQALDPKLTVEVRAFSMKREIRPEAHSPGGTIPLCEPSLTSSRSRSSPAARISGWPNATGDGLVGSPCPDCQFRSRL